MAYKNKNNLWKIIGIVVLIVIIIAGIFFYIRSTQRLYNGIQTFQNMNYSVSPCNQEDQENFTKITINEDHISIHQKVKYVCCANITLRYEINGNQLNVYEDNKGLICRCMCTYEINANIPAQNIAEVKVYGVYYPEVHPYELLGELAI